MQLYPKVAEELVFDLIKQSNPDLTIPLTTSNVRLGIKTNIAPVPPAIQDTQVALIAKPGGTFIGSIVVKYQRIDLSKLYKSMKILVSKYSATGDIGGNVGTLYQYRDLINAASGLLLREEDFTDQVISPYITETVNGKPVRVREVTLTINSTCAAYKGAVTIRVEAAPKDLTTVITKPELPARVYPGGPDFGVASKYRLDIETFGIDWTSSLEKPIANRWGTFPMKDYLVSGVFFGNPDVSGDYRPGHQAFLDLINLYCGTQYYFDSANLTTKWNVYGGVVEDLVLPNTKYPEANSVDYKKLIVITLPAANSWGVGKFFIHHNYGV